MKLKNTKMITQSELKQLLDYDTETGIFTWKVSRSNVKAGDKVGTLMNRGYLQVGINKKMYLLHRLAFLWMTGSMPKETVDHKNGIRTDNRWNNLREATTTQNQQNLKKMKSNNSGYTGVYWNKRRNKWHCRIKVNKKNVHIGYYDCVEDAANAYREAKRMFHTFSPELRE